MKKDSREIEMYKRCLRYGRESYGGYSEKRHSGYARSVVSYVCGGSLNMGGPCIREHICSWHLAGPKGQIGYVMTDLGKLTVIQGDGSLPESGKWDEAEAMSVCEDLVYKDLGEVGAIWRKIVEQEYMFDNCELDKEYMLKRLTMEKMLVVGDRAAELSELILKIQNS